MDRDSSRYSGRDIGRENDVDRTRGRDSVKPKNPLNT